MLPNAAVAAIELNGAPVGFTANTHRPHAFHVTGLLALGGDDSATNHLAITLFSAPDFAAAQAAAYPYEVPATEVRIWVVHVLLLFWCTQLCAAVCHHALDDFSGTVLVLNAACVLLGL